MSTETTHRTPVTFVRDIEGGPEGTGAVFSEGTSNKLWQTEDGRYIATSWASWPATDEYEAGGETLAYESSEEGWPLNPMVYFGHFPGVSAVVPGLDEQHEQALNEFGYEVQA